MCIVSAVGKSFIVSKELADANTRGSLHVWWKCNLRGHRYSIHTQIQELSNRSEPYLSVPIIQLQLWSFGMRLQGLRAHAKVLTSTDILCALQHTAILQEVPYSRRSHTKSCCWNTACRVCWRIYWDLYRVETCTPPSEVSGSSLCP